MITDERLIEFYTANKWDFDIKILFEMLGNSNICDTCECIQCVSHTGEEQKDASVMIDTLINGDDLIMVCTALTKPNSDSSDCNRYEPQIWEDTPMEAFINLSAYMEIIK